VPLALTEPAERRRYTISARLATEQVLIDYTRSRGWGREVKRHEATCRRLQHLLDELDDATQ
jgi:hypothetical protein